MGNWKKEKAEVEKKQAAGRRVKTEIEGNRMKLCATGMRTELPVRDGDKIPWPDGVHTLRLVADIKPSAGHGGKIQLHSYKSMASLTGRSHMPKIQRWNIWH